MSKRRRGMTLTELLTVVSVIAILTSMMSPILMRAYKEAMRRSCMGRMKEISVGLQLVANDNFGKLPQCFDLDGDTPIDESWWYRKVARKLYPTDTYRNELYDHLTVPYKADRGNTDNSTWWRNATNAGFKVQRFRPRYTIFRCPATTDFYDQRFDKLRTNADSIDKDRAYDDNYGYNNTGFEYAGGHGKQCTIYYTHGGWFFEHSRLYHTPNDSNKGGYKPAKPVKGSYPKPGDPAYDPDIGYIGCQADVYDPALTILLADYIKADIAMTDGNDNRGDITVKGEKRHYPDGMRFRHGSRANVLFVDGHIEGFRDRIFRASVARGRPGQDIHYTVYRRPPTP